MFNQGHVGQGQYFHVHVGVCDSRVCSLSVLSGKFIMTRQLILQGIAFAVKIKDSKNVPFVAPY